MTFIKIK